MKKLTLPFGIAAAAVTFILASAPANAQATRTWVSGVGDDVNPCSRTAPCKTFAGAISKTASPGEINCLDPGGFGAVTITKSITIDCHEVFASILHSGVNGVVVSFDNFAATGGSVRLRNLNFNGAGTTLGTNSVRILGGAQATNSKVSIEDCLMDGNSGRGVSDERTAAATGARLNVKNCTIRNMGGAGIGVSGGSAVKVSIDNVQSANNLFGVAMGTGVLAMISNSVFSGNTNGGVETEGTSQVNVERSLISGNGIGLQVVGGTLRLSNSDVAFNTTGISGTVNSFTNNRFTGNGAGGSLVAVGGPTSASGQQ